MNQTRDALNHWGDEHFSSRHDVCLHLTKSENEGEGTAEQWFHAQECRLNIFLAIDRLDEIVIIKMTGECALGLLESYMSGQFYHHNYSVMPITFVKSYIRAIWTLKIPLVFYIEAGTGYKMSYRDWTRKVRLPLFPARAY